MADMTPGTVEFIADAPIRIETVVTLRQPPQRVWDVVADNESWPIWFRSCKGARTTSEPGEGIGATRWVHLDLFKVNERFIAWDEPRQWGFTPVDANLPIAETVVELVTFDAHDGGTRLMYTFTAELKPWMRPLTPVLRWRFSRLFSNSLGGLQPYLDSLEA